MTYRRNGEHVEELPEDFYSTRYYTDRLLEFLNKNESDEKPFFAYLAYTAPHDPLHAPKEYIAKYHGKYDPGWDVLRDRRLSALKKLGIVPKQAVSYPRLPNVPAWKDMSTEDRQLAARDMEVYAAMIDYMDEQIRRVLDYLKRTGQYNSTMIVFFSDNGANGHPRTAYPGQTDEHLKSFDNRLENRGLANSFIVPGPGWSQASMTPSRLFKGVPSEGGIRSPMIVKLPEDISKAGQWNHCFFHVRDVMPTFLDAEVDPNRWTAKWGE